MIIFEDIRKCVVFVGMQKADSTFQLVGSAFYLGRDKPGVSKADPCYLVTAKHVIDGIRNTGLDKVWLRINLKSGDAAWGNVPITDWFFHPTDSSIDVAILRLGTKPEYDHLVFPYSLAITQEKIVENEVGLGDEVFITGLFKHHQGSRRNIPIVRIGNLAAMAEEKISTSTFGDIDAYLIEARSIGGLSGSPVFLNMGLVRLINKQVRLAQTSTPIVNLLGLIHGHFDVGDKSVDAERAGDSNGPAGNHVNTGIAIVVPFHSIDAVIREYEKTGS